MIQKRCPITYDVINSQQQYSERGLKLFSPKLTALNDLPFNANELRQEAAMHADKLSIQGVQPKLSAKLNVKDQCLSIVDRGGNYILKPPLDNYIQVPENEDLSMRLAACVGIDVPFQGMIYNCDKTLTYFIKRFDRYSHSKKIAVEDFAQLTNQTRAIKYNASMEKIGDVIERYCTFPVIEKKELLKRTLFNFLIGNEDMHLKNFSLITRDNKTQLAPAYDFLNTSIIIREAKEEIALSLNGKMKNLTKKDLLDYFGEKRLGLNKAVIKDILFDFMRVIPKWKILIEQSFLSETQKQRYKDLLSKRFSRLE